MENKKITDLAKQCVASMVAKDWCSKKMGMDIVQITPHEIIVKMAITKDMLNGFGSCHGGQIFTLADSTFAFACNVQNEVTVAAGADINFIQPAKLGDTLTAKSKKIHSSGRLGIYDISIHNQHNVLIAEFRGRSYTIRNKKIIE